MKSAVGERLRRIIEAQGRSQKEVALDAFEKAGSAGKPDTFEQKLSKLLNGDAEGARFFFDDPRRSEALRHSVGMPATAWDGLRDAVVLIALDVSAGARRFLEAQDVVAVFVGVDSVIDEVKAWTGPRLVVTGDWTSRVDRAIAGALEALEVRLFTLVPEGDGAHATRWRLLDGPALFPFAHEPVPTLVDGWPVFPSTQEPRGAKQQRDYERYGCVLLTPMEQFPRLEIVVRPPPLSALWNVSGSRHRHLWVAGGVACSFGVKTDETPGLDVTSIEALTASWTTARRREAALLHPQARTAWWRAQFSLWLKALVEQYGFDAYASDDHAVDEALRVLALEEKPWLLPPPAPRPTTTTTRPVRAVIEELLARETLVPARWLFVLRAMTRAEAIATTHPPAGAFVGAATFDMGAGALITAVAWRFTSPATPVELVEPRGGSPRVDGGDLVVELLRGHEELLEGSAPWRTGRRRRVAAEAARVAAEEAAAQEEQDAWDD